MVLISASLFFAVPASASPPSYTVTALPPLSTESTGTQAYAINGKGHVAGYAFPSDGFFKAVLWAAGRPMNLGRLDNPSNPFLSNNSLAQGLNDQDEAVGWSTQTSFQFNFKRAVLFKAGKIVDLGALPNYLESEARAINNHGQIVGFVGRPTAGGGERAFLWESGVLTALKTLGGASIADDINDSGQIVGKSYLADSTTVHAFVYQNGAIKDLGALGVGTFSVATAINGTGQIVGASSFDSPGLFQARHPIIYENGRMKDLGAPTGFTEAVAADINDRGTIVGNTISRGFIYQDGSWTDLNALIPGNSGWTISSVSAINASGQITGTGRFNGQAAAYLLTPVKAL